MRRKKSNQKRGRKTLAVIISALMALGSTLVMIPQVFASSSPNRNFALRDQKLRKIHEVPVSESSASNSASQTSALRAARLATSYEKTFIITSYYSPLPGQKIYLTGTLEGDQRINGGGVRGADRTLVYEGMVAAPPNYPFGTKVDCPPFFSGEVHDRGGAIVKAGTRNNAHDRIDVWAGPGEEGLKKALFWGKRTMTCTVYSPDVEGQDQYVRLPESSLSLAMLKSMRAMTSHSRYDMLLAELGYNSADKASWIAFQLRYGMVKSAKDPLAGSIGPNTRAKLETIARAMEKNIPEENLQLGSTGEKVRTLQAALSDLKYLKGKLTGHFGEQTKEALIHFQLDQKLISDRKHPAAGYVGPGTVSAIKKIVNAKPYLISQADREFIEDFHFDDVKKEMIAKADELAKENPELQGLRISPDPYENALQILKREWLKDHREDVSAPEELAHPLMLASIGKKSPLALAKVRAKLFPIVTPFSHYLGAGVRDPLVKKLQTFLKSKGYFKGDLITENFGTGTREALIAFQLDHHLIDSKKSLEAGIVGPKTLKTLNTLAYTDKFSAPHTLARSIRGPAINPDDLEIPSKQTAMRGAEL